MRAFIIAGVLLLSAGCGSDDSGPSGAHSTSSQCRTDGDCEGGTCHLGVCSAECSGPSDCGAGNVCVESAVLEGGVQVLSGECPDLAALPRKKLCQPEQGLLVRELGEVQPGSAVILDFAEGAASFSLVGQSAVGEPVMFGRLTGPDGKDLFVATADPAQMLQNVVWFYPEPSVATMQVPTTPDHPLSAGPHCATVETQSPIEVTALVKRDVGGDVSSGRLALNLYFVGLDTAGCGLDDLTTANAATHATLTEALSATEQIFAGAKIELGTPSYHDRAAIPELAQLTTNDSATFDPVFALATDSKGYSVDVFIVPTIADGAGFAGHMPGPPGLHAVPRSGVVVSAQTACSKTLGVVIAHETSHLLGLFHNYQPDPGFEDPIQDTDSGQQNLMHITPTTASTELTAGQGFVLRRHPNVTW